VSSHEAANPTPPREQRIATAVLTGLLLVALGIRVGVGVGLPNVLHPDEVYLTLEQAHRLAFGSGVVPWEFREGARSWLIPGFLAGAMRVGTWLSASPTAHFTAAVAALSLLSLTIVAAGFTWAYRTRGLAAALITGALCATWFELVYFAPKAFGEAVAAYALVGGMVLVYPAAEIKPRSRFLFSGVLLVLAVFLRIHLAPAAVLAAVWVCGGRWRERWQPLIAGGLISWILLGILDLVTWGLPWQSVWVYVQRNAIEARAFRSGVVPWIFYFVKMAKAWSGVAVPMAFLALAGARRLPLLAWTAGVMVLAHMLVPHKEYRFIFPAIALVPILVGVGTGELLAYLRERFHVRQVAWTAVFVLAWAVASVGLAAGDNSRESWRSGISGIQALRYAGREPNLCGLGLVDIGWWDVAGYVHLHRNVPMTMTERKDLEKTTPGFNYAIARPGLPVPADYQRLACWQDKVSREGPLCVYRRGGTCGSVAEEFEVNRVVIRRGE
jgi:hypothetical protein